MGKFAQSKELLLKWSRDHKWAYCPVSAALILGLNGIILFFIMTHLFRSEEESVGKTAAV